MPIEEKQKSPTLDFKKASNVWKLMVYKERPHNFKKVTKTA